jgi:hypothetical protein
MQELQIATPSHLIASATVSTMTPFTLNRRNDGQSAKVMGCHP